MKKLIALILAVAMGLCLAACGKEEETAQKSDNSETAEVALIVDGDINDGGFNQVTWQSIENFCGSHDITHAYYVSKGKQGARIEATVEKAIKNGGKLIIFAGSTFDTAVYELQKEHTEIDFYLIDGVPHDQDSKYAIADNSIGVLFAEEEAGYLAGYAAVKDGYKNLGFMGGEDLPSVKRYGYGFVQGISAAATEMGIKDDIEVRYIYTGTFKASDAVEKKAKKWYGYGTEVIFSCGGAIVKSVIRAAESEGGRIIGADVDQSDLSNTIITSAEKGIGTAIEDVLKEYNRGNFIGSNVFHYTAGNGGVSLEISNARFSRFDRSQYDEIFAQIKDGAVTIKTDTDADDVGDLVGENVTIIKK